MKKRSAFTIVELLISIMIIGILAGLGYGQYTKAVDSAKAKGLISLIKKINAANADYFKTYGVYPESLANEQILSMLKGMEIQTTGGIASTDLRVLANLGPRVTFDLKFDSSYTETPVDATLSTGVASFRYIVVRNVPTKIAADVAKEINGVTNDSANCYLDSKNWFVAILPAENPDYVLQHETAETTTVEPSGTSCIPYSTLEDASSGVNNVDLWYTFSRTTNIKTDW